MPSLPQCGPTWFSSDVFCIKLPILKWSNTAKYEHVWNIKTFWGISPLRFLHIVWLRVFPTYRWDEVIPNIRTPDPLELCHESSLLPTGLEAMPTTSRSSGCGREIVTSLATAAVGRWSSLSRFSQGPKLGKGVFMSHFGSTLDTRVKQDLVVYVHTYLTYTNFFALAWKMGSGKNTKTPIKSKVPESWWRGISWATKSVVCRRCTAFSRKVDDSHLSDEESPVTFHATLLYWLFCRDPYNGLS